MPDEKDEVRADEEKLPETSLHAHAEGRDEDIKGEIGGGPGSEQDADTVEKTGGATSGGPGGAAEGEEDPSQVDENAGSED
jgi:hypothetical protein